MSETTLICPNCGHAIPLTEALTAQLSGQLEARLRSEHEAHLKQAEARAREEQHHPALVGGVGKGLPTYVLALAEQQGKTLEAQKRELKLARHTALPTHDHPEGVKGAQATVLAIYLARQGDDAESIRAAVAEFSGYDMAPTVDDIRPGYRFDETCQDSVPEALICTLEAESFEDAIRNAISIGGDSDTLAAIAGPVAEARFGIPEDIRALAWARVPKDMRDGKALCAVGVHASHPTVGGPLAGRTRTGGFASLPARRTDRNGCRMRQTQGSTSMKSLEYTLRFNTPAFLGNAEQNAQWRTPPIKALIRQWWRVTCGITDMARLRAKEGQLFGAANDERGGSQKSQLRLRLDSWSGGKLQGAWGNDPRVSHPEVGNNGRDVGAHLYLGYGPLEYRQGTALKHNAAIQAGETNTLRLAWPGMETSLAELVQLLHWFGTLGGRSRNGWGSLEFLPPPRGEGTAMALLDANHPLLRRISRPLADCLQHDWPHALGQSEDGRPLVWQSPQTFDTWREAMQALARAKIGFRTQFVLGAPRHFEQRHLLAYPVTHHTVDAWGNQKRLANQLRFKVARNANGKLVARIFHLPCALPRELAVALGRNAPTVERQKAIWQQVHNWLDNANQSGFRRI